MVAETTRQAQRNALLVGELTNELTVILDYWRNNVQLPSGKGFYAGVDYQDRPEPAAAKGLVMHARILWAFSAAFGLTANDNDLVVASNAYTYLIGHFADKQFGGFYWSLDAGQRPLDDRKHVYGQAFCLYGLAEYYRQVRDAGVLSHAIGLYQLIENRSRDTEKGGYIEAFNRDWSDAGDLRLSSKDQNDRKTMNTHLHIVEAYAALYTVWPDPALRRAISDLLALFSTYFIDSKTGALRLFFNDDWQVMSSLRSYGHDIEASWLLLQCAQIIHDQQLSDQFGGLALLTADAASAALDTDGALWYESDPETGEWIREKHWWPQAEAMVGFMNAYEISGRQEYLERSVGAWEFVKQYLLDRKSGEWYWGVYQDHTIIKKEKAGFWKCPYHNARACIELINRLK